MVKNMASVDRWLRAVVAAVVATLILTGRIDGLAATTLGVLAAVFLITGLLGSCPLYSLFGLSTCRSR